MRSDRTSACRSPAITRVALQTGAVISPIVAAALCVKPRDMLTQHQAEKVDVVKQELPILACMRSLAMRFRGLLRGNDLNALDNWIGDATGCEIHAMPKFAAKLRHDVDAIRNAIRDPRAVERWPDWRADQSAESAQAHNVWARASVALRCSVPGCIALREVEYHQV